ncbi:hypothetical protein J1TS1_39180 [Shouchella clausii]|nr:hypothetical protein J1TS1_39180 [Shouchella clausii]
MGYRYYFETIIMIFIASHLTNLHKSNLIVFVKGLIISSVVISLLGIYISIFLGIPFMFEVGYTNYNGAPHYSYLISGNNNILRVFGTFASPNNLATFLSIVIISQIIIKDEFKWKKFYWVTLFIQVLALFLTFSRSSWLAFLLCLLIYFLFLYRASKAIRNFILATFITMCSGIIYILLHPENAVWSLFVRTITLQDSSTIGHIDSWINDFKFILDNPLGIGLGLAGPKAFQETGVYLVPENSYYLLAFEVGIIGMCLFLGFNIILFGVLLKKFKRYAGLNKKIIGIGLFSLLILNFVFLFLPTIQEMEVTIIAYTLIGLALGIKNDETHKLSGCGGCL